jgi:hypothetical protein
MSLKGTVFHHIDVVLDGLVVSMLATVPKVRGFKPGRRRWFLRAINIRSMPSCGGKIKLSAPCC